MIGVCSSNLDKTPARSREAASRPHEAEPAVGWVGYSFSLIVAPRSTGLDRDAAIVSSLLSTVVTEKPPYTAEPPRRGHDFISWAQVRISDELAATLQGGYLNVNTEVARKAHNHS